MSALDRLFANLYTALNADPQPVPALRVGFTPLDGVLPAAYWIEVRNSVLYGTNGVGINSQQVVNPLGTSLPHANLVIPLRGLTLQAVCDTIAATAGFTCQVLPGVKTGYGALMLAEGVQDVVAASDLPIATSLLWAILRPIADALAQARDDTTDALQMISPQHAAGLWLSSLGDLYSVDRQLDETDDTYRQRVLYTVLKPKVNNVAMADYLRFALALQSVAITDDDASQHTGIAPDVALPFRFFVDLTPNPAGGLPISPNSVYNIVQAIKAWGTIWALRIVDRYSELYAATDVEETVGLTAQSQPEDATAYGKNESYALTVIVPTIEPAGLSKAVFMASVWKTNDTTNLPTQAGYDPSLGAIVATAASDPSVVTAAHDGRGFSSIVDAFSEEWHDTNGGYEANDNYTTTATVSEAFFTQMRTEEVYTTTETASDLDSSHISAATSDTLPLRWRPFRASYWSSQASTLCDLVSDSPLPRTDTAYITSVGEVGRFGVVRGGVTTWYSDANHPASF